MSIGREYSHVNHFFMQICAQNFRKLKGDLDESSKLKTDAQSSQIDFNNFT